MGSTSTRKAPNCFNFLRQLEIIERSGSQPDFVVAWPKDILVPSSTRPTF